MRRRYNGGSLIDCVAILINRLERGRIRFQQFLHILEVTIFVEESNQLRYCDYPIVLCKCQTSGEKEIDYLLLHPEVMRSW